MTKTSFKLRGVNLGGWLVLEKWMTPSLFDGTDAKDEYIFMQTAGAREKLEHHRKTFISENDFEWMAVHGVNAVRIPVGYWLLTGEAPYAEGIQYLDWAMEMAAKNRLHVLIDLHGAKGSQNGNDHSGRIGKTAWFSERSYRVETITVLGELARRYRDSPAFWGIELLNEPKVNPFTFFTLRKFYREAYRELQQTLYPGTYVVFSDAFVPCLFTGSLRETAGIPLIMDIHWYQFGKTEIGSYFAELARRPEEIERLQRRQPIIIGEWSGMLSRQTLAGLSGEKKAVLQKEHLERQLEAYESAAGWFYWTYKTEQAGIWNFRSLVEKGMFPTF